LEEISEQWKEKRKSWEAETKYSAQKEKQPQEEVEKIDAKK